MVAAIGALVSDRNDAAVAADLKPMHDATIEQSGTTLLCARDVNGCVVFRLNGTNRNAAAVAAARRTLVAHDGIAALRRCAHVETQSVESLRDRAVEVAR